MPHLNHRRGDTRRRENLGRRARRRWSALAWLDPTTPNERAAAADLRERLAEAAALSAPVDPAVYHATADDVGTHFATT
jgi:hypothetical protein